MQLFAVDMLVRSRQLHGIDLHLRYVERTPSRLVLHLAFYNNGSENVAFVRGADPKAARLRGVEPPTPSAIDPTFAAGIAPAGTWYAGGATNGTISFAASAGPQFTLEFPGFAPLPFRLDTPLREAPEPAPAPDGSNQLGFELVGTRPTAPRVTIGAVRVTPAALEIHLAIASQLGDEASGSGTQLMDAVLFDARWNQSRPSEVSADAQAGPASGAARVLRFARPTAGDVVLLQLPGYPLVRLPLRAGVEPALAQASDLPPSVEPRPIVAAATPGPAGEPRALDAGSGTDGLIEQLNRSLRGHDRAAYLGLFTPELRPDQSQLFDSIAALPLENVVFRVGGEPQNGSSGRYVLPVTVSYAVRDVDPSNMFTSTIDLDLQREGTQWRIAGIGGELPYWMYGPAAAQRVGAFWVFYRPAMRQDLPLITQQTAAAWERVTRALPNRARPTNVMFVTETAAEFQALTGRDPARLLGLTLSRYVLDRAGITIRGAAFYINGAAFRTDARQDLQRTIAHELTHLVLAPETMPFTPLWLVEGIAMYVSQDLPAATMRSAIASRTVDSFDLQSFTAAGSFVAGGRTAEQTELDYALSAYLMRYLVETYGWDRVTAFYHSFAGLPFDRVRGRLAAVGENESEATLGAVAAELTPGQFEAVFGADLATSGRDFKRWLVTQLK